MIIYNLDKLNFNKICKNEYVSMWYYYIIVLYSIVV